MVYLILTIIAIAILVMAGVMAFPIILAMAVAVSLYTIAKTVFEHNHWKTYMFDGASGVAIVVILTFIITVLL